MINVYRKSIRERIETYEADSLSFAEKMSEVKKIKDAKKREKEVKRLTASIDSLNKTHAAGLQFTRDRMKYEEEQFAISNENIARLRQTIHSIFSASFSNTSIVLISGYRSIPYFASAGKTRSRELRIHTDYGFAYTPFNSIRHGQTSGYWAARIYFCQLDKQMIRPYKNHQSRRFSILIGSVLPNALSYKGQKLGNVGFLNIKPIFGIGFDINKFIGLNIGTVVFTQKDPNPLINQRYTIFSPFVSLSIDLNLLNQIKNFQNP
jgi:hypothetical protein